MSDLKGNFNLAGFYGAIDSVRKHREINWKQVAKETGVSASTLSRMSLGKRPDADSLATLSAWSGVNPAGFVSFDHTRPANFLSTVSQQIYADPNLSEAGKAALDDMIKAAYSSLAKPAADTR